MVLTRKTGWYSAEKKIVLTIASAILIASVSVFAILYLMMSNALQEDIRARARVVNAYAESHLSLEGSPISIRLRTCGGIRIRIRSLTFSWY